MYSLFLISLGTVLPVAVVLLLVMRKRPPESAAAIVLLGIVKIYVAIALVFVGLIAAFLLFLIFGPGKGSIWSN